MTEQKTFPSSDEINWHHLQRYCGSGVSPGGGFGPDHEDGAPSAESGALLQGVMIDVMPSFRTTPASKAGLRSGDVITHIREMGKDWQEISRWDELESKLVGTVGSKVQVMVLRLSDFASFETTIQKDWIVPIYPGSELWGKADLEGVVQRHLHKIPLRSPSDIECEPISALPSPLKVVDIQPSSSSPQFTRMR